MNSTISSYPAKLFNTQSNVKLINSEFHLEKSNEIEMLDLYYKYDDEPDFDCEFLHGISHEENNNTTDSEFDEDLTDDYRDNEWDIDIYDPYEEATYF
ncbi:hypothetical protein K6T82_11415 [Flavobacterium sp. 17A]|uniref:Uncharacterized protein n=1 Tax=Flavobacterium potami TaxID=2872310 RepID=A0A9X1KQU9_9FLAO|nr:hypothetical protein [Flavobacterium potami]MBZ4035377.1 hypothetical protein [Flavobacterium potami]